MGILEIHLNDPKFEFAPRVGGAGESEESKGTTRLGRTRGSGDDGGSKAEESSGRRWPGALVGLVLLVGMALAVRKLRSRGDSGGMETESETTETKRFVR